MKVRNRQQLAELNPDQVLDLISSDPNACPRWTFEIGTSSYSVRTCTQKLNLLKANPRCVTCGRIGSKFVIERDWNKGKNRYDKPHLNFYSADNILMTKDHIIPKSKGGLNDISNYQTMCEICNVAKDDSI